MSKLNIFKGEWIDMVFEGRNKKYGAYQLRSENPKTTMKALIIGAALFSFLVAIPKIYEAMGKLVPEKAEEDVTLVDMAELPPPPVEELPPPPPPVEVQQAPKSIVEEVKLKPLEAVKKEEVPEDPPKIEQFKDANPGDQNKEASPTGDINIDTPSGDLDKGVEVPDNSVYNYAGLQVQPEFPGGMDGFYKYVGNNFRTPELDRDLSVKVFVTFVVEKDGSMTGIKAVRDPGYGLAKEAERVLKSIKLKWKPGIQNGKPVRAQYSLPIVVNIKS